MDSQVKVQSVFDSAEPRTYTPNAFSESDGASTPPDIKTLPNFFEFS